MAEPRLFPLAAIKTDGWFERVGEGIGSFQALCDIVGTRFFAFAMITGARITALTVDRRNPDNTLVDFMVGGEDGEAEAGDAQRLTLADFRRRLVSALVAEDASGPIPKRITDTEALQLHIGVRYLLLAPVYGYSLRSLTITEPDGDAPEERLALLQDGVEVEMGLDEFRRRLRVHVREELERVSRGQQKGAIDLARVPEAEEASRDGRPMKVVELLGAWPAPLAIFLRTPEGQMLSGETKGVIAKGLGLLGSACIDLGELDKGEEVLRLAVQYAGDGEAAAEVYGRLGNAMLIAERPGEAIGPIRRALNLGADGRTHWPRLALALTARRRFVAALGAILEARDAGTEEPMLAPLRERVKEGLGDALTAWTTLTGARL